MKQVAIYLECRGLLNKSTEDLGVLALAKPITFEPFCTSTECGAGRAWQPIRKYNLNARPVDCPDCGHALLYKKVRGTVVL